MIGLEPRSCSKNQSQGLSAFSLFSFKNLKEPFLQSTESFFLWISDTFFIFFKIQNSHYVLPRMRKVLYNFLTELADFSRRYKQYGSQYCCCSGCPPCSCCRCCYSCHRSYSGFCSLTPFILRKSSFVFGGFWAIKASCSLLKIPYSGILVLSPISFLVLRNKS